MNRFMAQIWFCGKGYKIYPDKHTRPLECFSPVGFGYNETCARICIYTLLVCLLYEMTKLSNAQLQTHDVIKKINFSTKPPT